MNAMAAAELLLLRDEAFLPLGEMIEQEAQEGAAAAAPVVVLDFEALEKDERAEQLGIADGVHTGGLVQLRAELFKRLKPKLLDGGGVRILGAGLIDEAALHGAVGADERVDGLADVVVAGPGSGEGGVEQPAGGEDEQLLVVAEEVLGDADLLVRELVGVDLRRLLAAAGFLQVLAVERAIEGDLALLAAAEGADIAADGGASAPGLTGFAEAAEFHCKRSGNLHRSRRSEVPSCGYNRTDLLSRARSKRYWMGIYPSTS